MVLADRYIFIPPKVNVLFELKCQLRIFHSLLKFNYFKTMSHSCKQCMYFQMSAKEFHV